MATHPSNVKKYLCTGRVHPERADVSFSRIEMFAPAGRAVASCEASQLTVVLEVAEVDGWITAHVLAEDIANIAVGALGFALGSGYSVEIIQVTEEDGTAHVFGVRPHDEHGSTLGFAPTDSMLNRAFRHSVSDVFFRLALRDYLRATTDVTDCAHYCYRAIEALKAGVCQRTGGDGWAEMHQALGTDRGKITNTIKVFADPVRHGNWLSMKPTTSQLRWSMLSLTRDILVRYLGFLEQPSNER